MGKISNRYKPLLAPLLLLFLSGCAKLAPQAAFDEVAFNVGTRIDKRIQWDAGSGDDLEARTAVKTMLARPLSPSSAVQIALLNNRELQAAYADVGIAQADLVQAGLLKNPVFDSAVTWFGDAGGTPNLAFGVAWSFVDLLKRPRRKAVARSSLKEAQLKVARRVIIHAADTRAAFVDYVTAKQEVDLFRTVGLSARATVKAAAALRRAGNITALQFEQNQSFLTEAKLMLAGSEARADETRETLNVLMGLTGRQTRWSAPGKLPEIGGRSLNTNNVENRAVKASLEISMARQKLITLGRQFRLVRKQTLLPDIETGAEFEREVEVENNEDTGEKEKTKRRAFGPTFEVEIPIFDRGQARKAGVLLKIQAAENELWALAVRVRSSARVSRARLLASRKKSDYIRNAVLPQRARILRGTQQDYNAMQESVFQLISAKRQQILAGGRFIQAQSDYWRAHIRFQQLMNGTLPGAAGAGAVEMASASTGGGGEGGH